MEGFRLRKNDDVFFCNVWLVEWCDSRDGGLDNLGCNGNGDACGDGTVLGAADLDELNILLKKPGFSFGCGVTAAGGSGAPISFVFSYPTWGAGAESVSKTGSGGASVGLNLGSGLRPTVALLEDLVLRRRSTVPLAAGFGSILGSGWERTGMDGAVVSFRGPPGTVGVGAAS
jgi:hypothetical protein